jgi:hypothetical protein
MTTETDLRLGNGRTLHVYGAPPDDGHISVLHAVAAALGWLGEHT